MNIISVFDHSLKVELVLHELEKHHIRKEDIFVSSLNKKEVEKKYMDFFNADGFNMFFVASVSMIMMLLGTIYGFVLYLGPILWGLIGLIAGICITIPVDYLYKRWRNKEEIKPSKAELIIVIHCEETQVALIESLLYQHHTIGLVKI
ncbi:hypothetical protein [Niallia circulans]|uniref:hypothetical protein n=1 Tax=Niallia circulans TaxID=1397 RepID=UPI0026F14A14|nr:hypothetical protein [Niallia circulans]